MNESRRAVSPSVVIKRSSRACGRVTELRERAKIGPRHSVSLNYPSCVRYFAAAGHALCSIAAAAVELLGRKEDCMRCDYNLLNALRADVAIRFVRAAW